MINRLHMAMIELYKGDAKRIQHFCKVHSYAKLIAQMENVDDKCLFIIETAALTHDIGIHTCEEKYGECGGKLQEKEGPAIAAGLLDRLGFDSVCVENLHQTDEFGSSLFRISFSNTNENYQSFITDSVE